MSRAATRAKRSRASDGRSAPAAAPVAAAPIGARGTAVTGAVLIVAWAILFMPQLFLGQAFLMGDARTYRPFAEYSRARWQTLHQRTHWNPFLLAGLPATASLADARPQYLPDAALDLYETVRIGRWIPMGAPLFAHLAGMLAMAALARRVARAGPAGMMFAGIAWGALPDLIVPLAFGQDAKVVTMSLTPVALLAAHAVITTDRARAPLAASALALVVGVMLLTGHPQFVVYAGIVLGLFALVEAWSRRRTSRLAWIAGAGALALAMSAAVWLPAMLYGAHSFRGGAGVSLDEVRGLSFAWRDLLTLGWPQAVGWSGERYWGGLDALGGIAFARGTDYGRYVGASVLAIAGFALVRRGVRTAHDRLWLGLALFGMVFSIGARLGPLYTVISHLMPFASRFRVASAVLFLAELATVLIAARAFSLDPAPAGARTGRPGMAQPLAIGIGAALLLAGLGLALGPLADAYAAMAIQARPGMAGSLALAVAHQAGLDLIGRIALAAAAVALLVAMQRNAGRRMTLASAALVLLVAIDLGSVSIPPARHASGPASALGAMPAPELAKIGAADPSSRVWSTRRMLPTPDFPDTTVPRFEAYSNDWITWRARGLAGDHGAPPSFWLTLRQVNPTISSVLAMGVTYVSAEPGVVTWDSTLFQHMASGPREEVYRIRNPLGRAYAVPQVTAPAGDMQILALMSASDFRPREVAFASDPAVAGAYPGSRGARLRWLRDDPDTLSLAVEAQDRAFVVVADSDVPGWMATIDGQAAQIHRVNQLARGIIVPAGSHRIDMHYVPEGWTRGVASTRVGLLVWMLAAIAALGWSVVKRRTEARPA
jgi:hypothetical protein